MPHSPRARPSAQPPRAPALPTQCEVCRRWSTARLCPACIARHAAPRPRCARCGLPTGTSLQRCGDCQAQPLPFEHSVVALDYRWPWDRMLSAFKFHGRVELAKVFGALMADAVWSSQLPLPQLVVPVPLAPESLRERGFNQAWELAREVARRLRLESCADALDRVATAAHQVELGRAARLANLRTAFVPRPRHAAALQGQRVLLVDDVMTTGATAREAAAALLRGGAGTVDVLVLARTESPREAGPA